MTAFASASDLTDAGVDLEGISSAVVDKLCEYASGIIRDEYPDIDDRIATEVANPTSVCWVCISMVSRALEAPEGSPDQEAVGAWSHSGSYPNGKGLYLTKAERGRLSGASALGGGGGAFTIAPTSSVAEAMDALPWWGRQPS